MAQEHDRSSSDHPRYRRSLERRRGACVKVEPSGVATAHCSYFGIMPVGDDCTAGAVDRSSTPRSRRGRSSRISSAMFFCAAARVRRIARSGERRDNAGQDSSPPRRGGVSIPAAQTCSKSRSSATRKSTSGLPTYGAVSLLLHSVTISPGSPTLQMLRCTEVSQQNDVTGHSQPGRAGSRSAHVR